MLDYNTEFKTANQVNTFYDPGPYRASDHDPVVIGLTLNTAPTATFNAPAAAFAGLAFTLSLTNAIDPDTGETLTYAFDCGGRLRRVQRELERLLHRADGTSRRSRWGARSATARVRPGSSVRPSTSR